MDTLIAFALPFFKIDIFAMVIPTRCDSSVTLIFLFASIPCYVILYLGWRVAVNIGKDRSFSLENARHIKLASKIILFDALYFFVVNVCMWRIYVNHPGVILALVFIVFACVVVSVVAAVLSHLVVKAADLQEQSDLTI